MLKALMCFLLKFQILELAVIATLITAPIGSFGISLFGPKLLSRSSKFDPMNVQENEGFQKDEERSEPSSSASGQRSLSADHSVSPDESFTDDHVTHRQHPSHVSLHALNKTNKEIEADVQPVASDVCCTHF